MTTKYSYKPFTILSPGTKNTVLDVVARDILDVHKDIRRDYPEEKVLLLNMANADRPGGQYDRQKNNRILMGQEEYLFSKTDLGQHLTKDLYPIKPNEVLLSRMVKRNGPCVDIVSCPAVDVRYVQYGTRLNSQVHGVMYRKIKTIFQVAKEQGYNTLILSALGCGGFAMPPEAVSVIFRAVINEYNGQFSRIVFAIKCQEDFPKNNYHIFRNTFVGRD